MKQQIKTILHHSGFLSLLLTIIIFGVSFGQGIPIDRLKVDSLAAKLTFAEKHLKDKNYSYAAVEITRQLEKDSTLLTQAAILLGGNYSLVRITDNVFADRVGGFSPSGNKLIYVRDTSATHIDDGLFSTYENRSTGVVIYDFDQDTEIVPDLPYSNPTEPRFKDDHSFYFIAESTDNDSLNSRKILYHHEIKQCQTVKSSDLIKRNYWPYKDGVISYKRSTDLLEYSDLTNKQTEVLFDNGSILNLRRPLLLIQNISVGQDVIMFEAGYGYGKTGKNVYSLPLTGGKPSIETTDKKEFMSEGSYYPAVVNNREFAYLSGDSQSSDIYYMRNSESYRLTFDGGVKHYLAISPDGKRITYSYMIEQNGVESFEVFMLDFTRDATASDINYRINTLE